MPPTKSKKKPSSHQQPPPTTTTTANTPNWPALRPLVPSSDLYIDTILPDQIYTIRNFFTTNLCKTYVSFLSSTTNISLTTTPLKPKSKYEAVRVNDRYQIDDAGFAEMLWSSTALRELVSERRGLDGEEEDNQNAERRVWGGTPLGLNSNIRIYRYTPGQFFAQHYDESNTVQFNSPKSSSPKSKPQPAHTTWTLLIYLTTTEGGETVFYPDDGGSAPISVAPEVGMALLHRHGEHCLLHEGKEVRSGEKWVIRSDLVTALNPKRQRTADDNSHTCSIPPPQLQQRVMSSLQTMTAPAVGHRPPDPGIDLDQPLDTESLQKNHHSADDNNNNNNHSHGALSDQSATNPAQEDLPVDVKKEESAPERVSGNGEGQVTAPDKSATTEIETAEFDTNKKPQHDDLGKGQAQDKQSAATSLLAQLLGNAQQPAAPSTPDNLPQTPLPEPLTDVSTPVAPHDEPVKNEAVAAVAGTTADEPATKVLNGTAGSVADEAPGTAQRTDNPTMEEKQDTNLLEDPTRIPDMVSGVMEDPLSKSAHDHNGLFPPFDPEGGMKNGLGSLHQHDMLGSAFLAQELNMSGLPVSGIQDFSDYANPYSEVAASIAGSEPRIQAFAKLEFDDGHFYVNTYSFVLGRDVRAARAAHQRDMQVRQVMGRPSKNKSSSGGNTSHTPNRVKRDGSAYMGSVVSDRGGIMGFDPDLPHMNQKSRRSSLSSQPESALATPAQLQANHTDYNALAMQSLHDGGGDAKPVDALALLPSPDACPTIPIHPPATTDGMAAGHKGISRKHVKISYNFDKNLFEMEVMGRNGAFIGADWLAPGQVRPLHSGDYIQIGGVRIRFLLPDVPIGETGADRMEDTLMEEDGTNLVDADHELPGDIDPMDLSDAESGDGTQSRITKLILKTKGSGDSSNPPTAASVDGNDTQPKRRGPGRPPKDGIMSKRERAEIAREQKMAAKREANGGVTPPPSNKMKPPKPRGKEDSVEETSASKPPEKRKFAKRKQPDGTYIDVPIDSIEGGEQLPPEQVVEYAKPPPKKRKPSRSPSPDYPPESSYTQDQLAKPPYNYAVLIFDALTEAHSPMTLKQIYRALKLKYPYFRFKCETEGWTSSVRHNLNGNRQLFEHAERDGKGWSWQLRAGASVEKEKKRRPSPPPPSTHLSQPPSHQHYVPPTNNHYANQGVPNQQQFQFSSVTPTHYNAPPPPPVPQQNTYRPAPPPPPPPAAVAAAPAPAPAPAPPPQSSLPAPLRSTTLPGPFSQSGSSSYVSPYPCPLPTEIVQLQQSQQPPLQQQGMQQQRSSESIPPPPPPRQEQQTQPPPHQPIHHQQPQQPQPHQHYSSFSPPNPPAYPLANNHVHHHHHHPPPPQQAQAPPPIHQQGPQPMHNHQQTYPHPNTSSMPPGPPPPNHQRPMNQAEEPESSASFLERANKAIDDFEAVLMEDYDDKDYIREVLKSARARALGHAKESSFPDGEPKDEAVLLDALLNLIEGLRGSNTS